MFARLPLSTAFKSIVINSALFAALVFTTGCDDDEVSMPGTYSFENVSYTGQTQRQDMLAELTVYMKTANTPGTTLSSEMMADMYSNTNSPFADEDLNTSGKDLKSKTSFADQSNIENYILDFATATTASSDQFVQPGFPGVIQSVGGTKQYFFDSNGKEHIQLIEKGLMGSVFYSQITSVYLSDAKIGDAVDNINVEPGKGTDMEHHWDEAFGYLGLPVDYPAVPDDARFLGKYINSREELMGSGSTIMNAMIAGRFAITQNDMAEKDAQASIVIGELEKVMGGTGIHYINSALKNITDAAIRNHSLSEAEAFIKGLKYNDEKTITTIEIDEIISLLGDDFNNVSAANLTTAKTKLADALGLSDLVNSL